MALARSASGPGGLSINTGAANLLGGDSSQAPAKPAQSAPSLFGTAATAQPQTQTGGLFGAQPAQTSQPQSAPSLFGASTAKPQQPGGLFGTQQQAPAQQQQPQQQTGGLFGAAPASQPQQTGGFFGVAQTQQPAQTGGLFGTSTQQQPQQSTGGLFGASTMQPSGSVPIIRLNGAQTQPVGGGLFGGARPPFGASLGTQPTMGLGASTVSQPSALPGLTMGQSTQQQQQTVPGVRIDLSNLKGTTRFNDLQEAIQNQLTVCDTMVQHFMEQGNQVEAFLPAHGSSVESIPSDVRFVSRKYDGTASALGMDANGVKALQEMVKVDADNAKLSFKAVDNLKLPPQFHTSGLWSTRQQDSNGRGEGEGNSDLINLFSKTADEMSEQVRKMEKNLGEVEAHLLGVQSNVVEQLQRVANTRPGGQSAVDNGVAELAVFLREFEASIMKVATVVGGAREQMTALQLGSL